MAYECLTGRTVWSTEQGVAMTFAQIASAPLPDPSALPPRSSGAFQSVVREGPRAIGRRALPDRERAGRRARDRVFADAAPGADRAVRRSPTESMCSAPSTPRIDGDPSGRRSPQKTTAGLGGFEPSPLSEAPTSSPAPSPQGGSVGAAVPTGSRSSVDESAQLDARSRRRRRLAAKRSGASGARCSRCSASRDHRRGLLRLAIFSRPPPPPVATPPTARRRRHRAPWLRRSGRAPRGPNGLRSLRARRSQVASNNFPDAVRASKKPPTRSRVAAAPRALVRASAGAQRRPRGPARSLAISHPRPFGLNAPRRGDQRLAFTPQAAPSSRGPTTMSPRATTTPTRCCSIRRCAPRERPAT